MALTATHLADKSALARLTLPAVAARLSPMIEDGLVATCGIIDLEVGYSARDARTHGAVGRERASMPRARIDDEILDRAFDVQGLLARRGQHRRPIPDLVIAAAAESADLIVLHYDRDFDLIADVTGQPTEWVAPRGSV